MVSVTATKRRKKISIWFFIYFSGDTGLFYLHVWFEGKKPEDLFAESWDMKDGRSSAWNSFHHVIKWVWPWDQIRVIAWWRKTEAAARLHFQQPAVMWPRSRKKWWNGHISFQGGLYQLSIGHSSDIWSSQSRLSAICMCLCCTHKKKFTATLPLEII